MLSVATRLRQPLGTATEQGAALLAGASSGLLSALQHAFGDGICSRHFTSSAAREGGGARPSASAAAAIGLDDSLGEEESVMRLPSDLKLIGALNPRLRDVMLQHQSLQKSASAIETMLDALEDANPGAKRAARVNKSALAKLRVDQLRGLAESLGADTRGTKEAIVLRLVQIASSEQAAQARAAAAVQQEGEQGAPVPKEGVASRRREVAQATVAQRMAAVASRGGSYGMPEASLRVAHREMVEQGDYSRVFTPEEVADIFAEARADNIVIIDVRGRCPFTDWMVLATARSQRLTLMLAAAVLHTLKQRAKEVAPGVAPVIEGALDDSEWMVVDAGSVVAHVFLEGYREEYALEELWGARDGSNIKRVAPKTTVHTLDSLRD